MEISTDKGRFDGVIAASGPDLETEIEPFLKTSIPILFVNYAPCRIKLERDALLITERWYGISLSIAIESLPWRNRLRHVHWIQKPWNFDGTHKRMEKEDRPETGLVDLGFTVLTAIHFMVCMGCVNIFGAGVNLRLHKNGRYNVFGGNSDAQFIFGQIRMQYDRNTKPDLDRLGISFTSTGLK